MAGLKPLKLDGGAQVLGPGQSLPGGTCLGSVPRRWAGHCRLLESGSEPRKGYLFRRNLNGCMVEFSQRPADSGLPALPPPLESRPSSEDLGVAEAGVSPHQPPTLPHRHSRPRRCTIGTLLVGGMQLHTGCADRMGRGQAGTGDRNPRLGFLQIPDRGP